MLANVSFFFFFWITVIWNESGKQWEQTTRAHDQIINVCKLRRFNTNMFPTGLILLVCWWSMKKKIIIINFRHIKMQSIDHGDVCFPVVITVFGNQPILSWAVQKVALLRTLNILRNIQGFKAKKKNKNLSSRKKMHFDSRGWFALMEFIITLFSPGWNKIK